GQERGKQRKGGDGAGKGGMDKEESRTGAQRGGGDVKEGAAERDRKKGKREVLVMCDEPAEERKEKGRERGKKGRGAGGEGRGTPKKRAERAKGGEKGREQLGGKGKTWGRGKTNEKGEAEEGRETMGTYQDIDVTSGTEQEEG
ncbi:type VI secretion protein, partial [Enterococcus faecalis]|nr:type VI secretion protein [Enterococcus faecalis]